MTTLPTREEIRQILRDTHDLVCAEFDGEALPQYWSVMTDAILARLQPAWEELMSTNLDVSGLKDQDRLRLQGERDALRADVRALAEALKKETWEHRCSDGVGGCTAISDSALHNALARPGVRVAMEGK